MAANYPDWLRKMTISEIDKNCVEIATEKELISIITNQKTGETATLKWQAFPAGWVAS